MLYQRERAQLAELLSREGISSQSVLRAIARVPRHHFVPPSIADQAYGNCALSIGHGQTISQPYIVALMTEALCVEPGVRVLEIGTGSGYQAAVLSDLGAEVFSVEVVEELHVRAEETLAAFGYENIHLKLGDGSLGWPEHAPYDRIIVTAGAPAVPETLLGQMGAGGILVMPVGDRKTQDLVRLTRQNGSMVQDELTPCRFVPLVGQEGWSTPGPGRSGSL